MTLFPEVQERAQAEIDETIGGDRLPRISDWMQLRYCVALCKEIQRWSPVSPMGIPRTTREDDTYEGYFIPAKTTVFPNQCLHSRKIPKMATRSRDLGAEK